MAKVSCERCGSISVGRAQPIKADRLVALFSANRPFLCRRCGWRARRGWSDADLSELSEYGLGGTEADPALVILDDPQGLINGSNQRFADTVHGESRSELERFQLDVSNLTRAPLEVGDRTEATAEEFEQHHHHRKRRKRHRQAKLARAIAVTLLALSMAVLIGTGSCSGIIAIS